MNNSGNMNPVAAIDREKVCPLLLRVFCATSRHNNLSDYNRGRVPSNELQIYTWMDATLKELTGLVREVNPEARRKGTFFDFALVTPTDNPRGNLNRPGGMFYHYCLKDMGTTVSGRKSVDDNKTLSQCKFAIGDYIDISITPPNEPARLDRLASDRDHHRDLPRGHRQQPLQLQQQQQQQPQPQRRDRDRRDRF